jgi:serine/threonine protein kinase
MKSDLSDAFLTYICLQTLEAILEIHKSNTYFGNLKPENITVNDKWEMKLSDFSLSIKIPFESTNNDSYIYLTKLKGYDS